jgi:drug/metabolite transporter (DMT)-like permease
VAAVVEVARARAAGPPHAEHEKASGRDGPRLAMSGKRSERAAVAAPADGALRGVLYMLASTLLFSLMHASVRHVSGHLHAFQIAFFRNLFGTLVLLPWLLRFGLEPFRTGRFGLHMLRVAFNLVAMMCFFYALTIAPLAQVTALSFTAPIFATLLAIPILGETVRLRRWAAILLGFAGTLIILRPGVAEIGLGPLVTLVSSLAWACALMTIKTLGRTEQSITIIAYMTFLMTPLSLIPALFVWQWPSGEELLWLVWIGVIGTLGQWLMTESLRQADTAVVMPFDFFKLVWVSLIAYLAFREVPDLSTWLGGAVIFASTFYIAYREQQLAKVPAGGERH